MKIRWLSCHCFVPDLGEVKFGDERNVDYEYGMSLIKNGLAEQIKEKKINRKENEK